MRRSLKFAASAACIAALSAPVRAHAEESAPVRAFAEDPQTEHASNELAAISLGRGPAPAAPLAPLEDVLRALELRKGFSFIFDSRLVKGKVISRVEASTEPEQTLSRELAAVDLRLHKVTPTTFAIARAKGPASLLDEAPIAEIAEPPVHDTIVVLATAPIAVAALGSRRIFEIDSDQLAYLNVSNPAEALYDLPQSLASFTPSNTALYGAAAGISLADLRGLDPMHTIVMVNGRERTVTSGGNSNILGVDLNSIGEPFLERIEVHNLPGGARFGPQAVAGAINFVTKSNIEGVEGGARFGISEKGDAEEISLHLLAGDSFADGRGSISAGVNVTRTEGLIGRDREFSAAPWGFGLDGRMSQNPGAQFLPGFGGSSISIQPVASGVLLNNGDSAVFPGFVRYFTDFDGSIRPYNAELGQMFNWVEWQSVTLPNDRALGYVSISREVSPSVRLFADVFGGYSATDGSLAPLPGTRFQGSAPHVGDAAVVPLTSPTIPQALRDATIAAFGGAAQALIIDKRFTELGPRRQQVDRSYLDFAFGFEADASENTHYSLTYRYANNRVVSIENDRLDRNRLTAALDPAICQNTPGCVLGDIFAYGGLAPEVIDFVKIDELKRRLTVQEHEISARASHDMKFANGASGSLAAGLDLKRTILADLDLSPNDVTPIGQFNINSSKAHLDVLDAFVEANMPVLHRSVIGDLDATIAARATLSPTFDPAVNIEGGVDWRPASGVLLFTRQHVGRRTPTIADLFTIGTTVEAFFSDPCNDPKSQVVIDNCASAGPLGVPAGFAQNNLIASQTTYGNPQAKSEKIRSSVYGLTLTPTDMFTDMPGRLQITGMWLDYRIDDAVAQSASPVGDCYESINLSSPTCSVNTITGAPAIVRDPVSHQIISIDGVLENIGYVRWQGLDLELRYAYKPLDLGPIDRLWVNVLHTYTHRVVTGFSEGDRFRIDGLARDPHHRTLFTLGVEGGNLGLALFGNRRGRAMTTDIDIPETHISSAFYLDASARFSFDANTYVQFGVQNLTDTKPEITAFNTVGNFAPEYYDPVGRRFSLTFRTEF